MINNNWAQGSLGLFWNVKQNEKNVILLNISIFISYFKFGISNGLLNVYKMLDENFLKNIFLCLM